MDAIFRYDLPSNFTKERVMPYEYFRSANAFIGSLCGFVLFSVC